MLVRVFGATLALVAFAVVCIRGLLVGAEAGAVLRQALVGLAVGGVSGVLMAYIVRTVVREEFNRKHRRGEPAAGGEGGGTTAGQESSGESAAGQEASAGAPGTGGPSARN